ncbi:hypothetical protein [Streptomyces fodineus]|nr:hypothetical protein [Streptomyces fodineus]
MRRTLAALLPAIALTATLAPSAQAAPTPVNSPYTQASAVVHSNGELAEAKNVVSSWRVRAGEYCVKVDAGIDVAKATVLATPNWAGGVTYRKPPHALCGNDAQSIALYTFNARGDIADVAGFTVAIL